MKNKVEKKKILFKDKRGAVMTEFVLILPLYILSLLFMIFVYDFAGDIQKKSEEVRYELRDKIARSGGERFQPATGERTAEAIPFSGLRPFIGGKKSVKITLYGYKGYLIGPMKSEYRTNRRQPVF